MKNSSHSKTRVLYRRLLSDVRPFASVLVLGILANIAYSGIDAGFTYMARPFLDKSFIELDMEFVKKIPVIILVGVCLRGLMSALGSYCMTWVARSVVNVLRQRIFRHIIKLPAAYYDAATRGQLLSKILYDVEQVAQVSADALTDFVQNVCLVVGLLTVMMVVCWQLSMMFLITIPFIGLIVNYTNKRVRRISHKVQHSMSDVTEIAAESIDGYRVVRIFGGSDYEVTKFDEATERSRKNDMKVAATKAINVSGVQIVIAFGVAAIVLAAISLSTMIAVTPGSFMVVIAAMLQLIKPMKSLTTLNATIQRGLAGAESVFALLDTPCESVGGQILENRVSGDIAFEHVTFGYDTQSPVLHDIHFRVAPGSRVALVGHSGSGKSTIASLLPRFYEVSQGQIKLDGVSIGSIDLSSLREQIALVTQQVTLFNDTIANNIAYGQKNASIEGIRRAAKLAYADEFIEKLPQGYETQVGDNGVLLSGGQRQRIAIARAILKDAPILILDEATSALDTESEAAIQVALDDVMQGRTTIIIAHRLSTILHADQIIVLKAGRIVEMGTHEALLNQHGEYAKLYNTHSFVQNIPSEALA